MVKKDNTRASSVPLKVLEGTPFEGLGLQAVTACPLCGSLHREQFEWEPKSGRLMQVVRCETCGLLYADQAVAPEDVPKLYDGYSRRRTEEDPEKSRQREAMYAIDYAFVRRYFDDTDRRILDIGCGEGGFLAHFNACAKKYGVEPDRVALAQGRHSYPNVAFFESLDALPEEKFDAIIFRGTLQYLTDLHAAVDFCRAHIVPDGMVFLLAIPNSDSLLAQIQREHWVLNQTCSDAPIGFLEHRYTFGLRHLRILFEPAFNMVGYDLPYLGTPYENYEKDLAQVLKMFDSAEARQVKTPFFGSVVNMALRRVQTHQDRA
jgi:SAM-dependent methyltransferase